DAWPEQIDPDAAESAARLVERDGLGRAAFLVRIVALSGTWDADRRAAFWVAAVATDDVANLARHPILAGGTPVHVGGSTPRRELYARLLAGRHGGPVAPLGAELAEAASALGARAILDHRGW